jgi:hypothetical protein
MKIINVHVPGGLGNQLFAYFVALKFSLENNSYLSISLDSYDRSHTNGKFDITSFDLMSVKTKKIRFLNIHKNLKRISNGFKRRSTFYCKISDYTAGNVNQGEQSFFNSDIVDFRKRISDILSRRFFHKVNLYGYFQNYEFIEKLPTNFKKLDLVNPSTWFCNLNEAAGKKKPIMIHIRAGDAFFKSHFENVGVLHPEYFRRALTRVISEFPDREVWVFSNDITKVKRIYSKIHSKLNFIETDMESDPAETLMLLTRSCALIASNSTFSLISSVINTNDRLIVVPNKLTKNGQSQPNYLKKWITVDSIWLEWSDLEGNESGIIFGEY